MITSPGLKKPSPFSKVWVTVLVIFTAGAAVSNVLVVSSCSALLGSSEVSDTIPAVLLAVATTEFAINPEAIILLLTVTDAV